MTTTRRKASDGPAGRADCDYCCGGGGGIGAGTVRRGRGRIWPQFKPIMQSEPLAWGWAASAQQTPSGDAGVGAAIGAGAAIGGGAALARGIPAPPTPPSASASTAAPMHAAALPVRFAMAPFLFFPAECREPERGVMPRWRILGSSFRPDIRPPPQSRELDQRTPSACHQSYRAAWVLSGAMPCSATASIREGMSVQTR